MNMLTSPRGSLFNFLTWAPFGRLAAALGLSWLSIGFFCWASGVLAGRSWGALGVLSGFTSTPIPPQISPSEPPTSVYIYIYICMCEQKSNNISYIYIYTLRIQFGSRGLTRVGVYWRVLAPKEWRTARTDSVRMVRRSLGRVSGPPGRGIMLESSIGAAPCI